MSFVVTCRDLTFEFSSGQILFPPLSFTLGSHWTGLLGPNGVGKSTLARILVGDLKPSGGTLRRSRPIHSLPQREEAPQFSVAEYLGDAIEWSEKTARFLSGINLAQPCSALSGGQWMRVRLARIVTDDFLVLDEPTNDLDEEGRRAILDFMRDHASGGLLISHDREALGICQTLFEMSSHGLQKFSGSWRDYEIARKAERERLEAELEVARQNRQQTQQERREKIDHQDKRNRRGQAAAERGGMPKILLGARKRRAQATSGRVDNSARDAAEEAVRQAFHAFQKQKVDPVMTADLVGEAIPAQKLILEAQNWNVFRESWVFSRDLDLHWRGPLRCAIKGPNGSGKSTLLAALTGQSFISRGTLRHGDLRALWVDQSGGDLRPEQSVIEFVRERARLSETEIRNGLARFLFTNQQVFQPIEQLSGGERFRLRLARGLLASVRPQLLILDEPTNNLDLMNIEFLEACVRQFCGAVIVVSHDGEFIKNCSLTSELDLSKHG